MCRAVTAAIAVPALLLVAPAIAMAAGTGDTHGAAIHQVTTHQITAKSVVHETPTAISSTGHTVALPTHRMTSTSTANTSSNAATTPARRQVGGVTPVAAAPKAAPATAVPATPVVHETTGTARGWDPCGADAYACVHWHATYHWHGEYHVLGNNVEAGNYWNAGAYAEWSPTHDTHGHYWNAGSHVNVSHYYGDGHHGDDD
ncbi:hypothetical protein GCM10018954_038050 [Kutzneria kofuensis]